MAPTDLPSFLVRTECPPCPRSSRGQTPAALWSQNTLSPLPSQFTHFSVFSSPRGQTHQGLTQGVGQKFIVKLPAPLMASAAEGASWTPQPSLTLTPEHRNPSQQSLCLSPRSLPPALPEAWGPSWVPQICPRACHLCPLQSFTVPAPDIRPKNP